MGSAVLESAMLIPVALALLIGTAQLGKIVYTYSMLQKTMLTLARYLGTQQGVNFCDPQDPSVAAAVNYALTGQTDSADNPLIIGLTPDMFHIRVERYDPQAQQVVECDCSATGCDPTQGGLAPGFLAVSLTDGYPVRPVFWGFSVSALALHPAVRVPYAGT